MRRIIIAVLSTVLLSAAPGVWAGGMGGMGGGMMGGANQRNDRTSWYTDRYEREDRARRRFEEDTRSLRWAIDQKQDALDRELRRGSPDRSRSQRLRGDLNQLQDQFDLEQRRFDQYRQEAAGRYDDGRRYPRAWQRLNR